jgi:hypothetical protein
VRQSDVWTVELFPGDFEGREDGEIAALIDEDGERARGAWEAQVTLELELLNEIERPL